MDTEILDPFTLAAVLRQLEVINRWLGGVGSVLWHLDRFSKHWPKGSPIRFVDWGVGGADIPRAMVRWARKRGFHFFIIGVDNNPLVLDYARKVCRDYPEIQFIQSDLADLPQFKIPFDYAISSLCLHHLPDETIVHLLKKSDQWVRRGIIFSDLMRSRRAWAWIWALSRLLRADPVVQYDGPLSVRRAFTKQDLLSYAQLAELPYLKAHTHFGYRLTLAGEKV